MTAAQIQALIRAAMADGLIAVSPDGQTIRLTDPHDANTYLECQVGTAQQILAVHLANLQHARSINPAT